MKDNKFLLLLLLQAKDGESSERGFRIFLIKYDFEFPLIKQYWAVQIINEKKKRR